MTPQLASLRKLLELSGISLTHAQYDQLWHYHRLLREANPELNLTRIHNFENMVLKHYVDSLLVLQFVKLPSPLIDMGSGPGLPGIPLKIACPEVEMILAEPRGARADFLQSVIDKLRLSKIEVYAGRINSKYDRPVAGVITRAVASIPETLDAIAPCLISGGQALLMKGPDCGEEVAESKKSRSKWFRFDADHFYMIPNTTHKRRLVVFERTEQPANLEAFSTSDSASTRRPDREATSEANPQFKLLKELLQPKGIREHGQALIAGSRVTLEVFQRHRDQVLGWVTNSSDSPPSETTEEGAPPLIWLKMADKLFQQVDLFGTRSPLLWVQAPTLTDWEPSGVHPAGCTLFAPFQDPENVGAVIRSAAAFGVKRVVLLKEAAHPYHPKAARAAGSALFEVELLRGPSLRDLGDVETNLPLVALDLEGQTLDHASWPDQFGLIIGLEGPGLPEALKNHKAEIRRIPIASGVESLNAAVAASIALYEWRRNA